MNKEERKAYNKQYRLDNIERIKQYNLDNKEKRKQWRLDNKEQLSEYDKQYKLDNKERIKEYQKEWNKQWYQNNKEQILEQRNQYRKERYYSDPVFKFKRICRCRTLQAFKQKSWKKNGGTEKLLGCDWKTAMNHIESQFVGKNKWMNWDNHGEWHIDHYTPLASANTIEEMTPLFHYTNLQPLLAEDNIRKGDKILKLNRHE